MMRRRVAALLVGPAMIAALSGCGGDDGDPSNENVPQMMQNGQRSAGPDDGGVDSQVDWMRLRHQMQGWCDDLLNGRSWSELNEHQRAATMRQLHEQMNRYWGGSAWPLMMSGWGPPHLMTRGCQAPR